MSRLRLRFALTATAAVALFGFAFRLFADVRPSTVAYLQAQPQNPWITMALAAAGVTNSPTSHLRTVSGSTANDYATTVLALAAVGENPATFGAIDYVAKLNSFATAGQLGDPNFLNDDAWGILALSAAGVATATPEVTNAAAFLRSHQNQDGGFSYAVGGASDTNSTAAAVMALRESGLPAGDAALQAAVGYLRGAQNADGGFPYQPGDESDADSTAWVVWAIRKLGDDFAHWQKTGVSPLAFIESLANPDGSFSWMKSAPGPNPFATQDAALALSGATMPVGYYRFVQPPGDGYLFRLEGRSGTICYRRIAGVTTAYDLLVSGQQPCGYTFTGQTYAGLGVLLTAVNDELATGTAAWFYLVNHAFATVGLEGYQLHPGDEVLLYYDPDYRVPQEPDYDRPLQLQLAPTVVTSGKTVTATVTTWREGQSVPVSGATVSGAGSAAVTATDGTAVLSPPDGVHHLVAVKPDFIRSLVQELVVGSGVPGTVGLAAEILSPSGGGGGGGTVGGAAIIFTVDPVQADFGQLHPGGQARQTVTLRNGGTVGLAVRTQVFGDPLFTHLVLDEVPWVQYRKRLASGGHATTTVTLPVPADYLGRGVKTGELIFWAEAE